MLPERADLLAASMTVQGQDWIFSATTAKPLVWEKGEQANVVFLIDVDDAAEDNAWNPQDRRVGSDAYYMINSTASSTKPWEVRRYRYDIIKLTWVRFNTSSTFEMIGGRVQVKVPVKELPASKPFYRWRVMSTLGTNKWVARDAAPELSDDPAKCGYIAIPPKPDPKAPRMSYAPTSTKKWGPDYLKANWRSLAVVGGVLAVAAAVYFLLSFKRRKKIED
jgi:hypothetical protein